MLQLIDIIRFLPVGLFLVYLVFASWVIKKYPLGKHRSVSDHIAHSGKYFRVSVVIFSIIAIGLCANLIFWIAPKYSEAEAYRLLTVFFLLGGLGLSWFPADVPGSKKREHLMHVTSAFTLYFTIMTFSIVSIFAAYDSAPIASAVAQSTLVIYTWLMSLYFFYKPSHDHFVFYETIGISTFFILFIALAFNV